MNIQLQYQKNLSVLHHQDIQRNIMILVYIYKFHQLNIYNIFFLYIFHI